MERERLTHKERLEVAFRLKVKVLQHLVFKNKHKARPTDIMNLLLDLIEIRKTLLRIKQEE